MTNHIDDELDTNEQEDVDPFETPLAKEFMQHCSDVGKQIAARLDTARKFLNEAQELADAHGVPFHASISPLSNSYVPKGFSQTKFAALDQEVICEIAGVWGEYIDDMLHGYGCGWVHSAVC